MDTKPHRNDTNADAPLSNSARYDAQERLQKVLATIPLWRRIHAHIVLWAEAIWPIISPALAFMLIWIGLAALDVFSAYPGSGLLSLLIVLGLGGYLARNQPRQAIWPDQYAVLRRLETDNRLKHRPFSSLTDDLANTDDAVTRALWARHLARLKQTLPTRLSVGGPQTHAARRDPFALRYLAVLLAILGIAIAGNDTIRRLGNALSLFLCPLEQWRFTTDGTVVFHHFFRPEVGDQPRKGFLQYRPGRQLNQFTIGKQIVKKRPHRFEGVGTTHVEQNQGMFFGTSGH